MTSKSQVKRLAVQRRDKEKRAAVRQVVTLQDALDILVKKFDAVRAARGIDDAMKYHNAGSVLQSVIEDLRNEFVD